MFYLKKNRSEQLGNELECSLCSGPCEHNVHKVLRSMSKLIKLYLFCNFSELNVIYFTTVS